VANGVVSEDHPLGTTPLGRPGKVNKQAARRLARVGDAAQGTQVFPSLVFHSDPWHEAGVHDQDFRPAWPDIAKSKVGRQGLEIRPVVRAQTAKVAAAVLQALSVRLVLVGERERIVVSQHREHAVFTRELHDALGVRALGHEIASQDHPVPLGVAALAQEEPKLLGAPVYIADDDGPLHRTGES